MSNIDETIAHMIEVLNPKQRRRTGLLRPEINLPTSPLKRRLSTDSFTDTPEKVSRSENSLDVSWIASPREARRMRNDLLEARNHITDLEHRIQHMHGVRKELQTMFDNEIKSLQLQHEQDVKKIEHLEIQMQSIRKREKEAKDQLDEAQNDYRSTKLDYEARIEELEFTINELQSQLDVYEQVENQQVSMVQYDNNELTEALENAEKETQYYKELHEDLKSRLARLTKVSNDVEIKEQSLQAANLKIKSLEYTIESYGEWQIQSKIQQQKIISYPELEKEVLKLREEAKNLRDEVKNKLILEEQVHDLNTRLEHYRGQDKKLSALQASNVQLERVVDDWCVLARALVEEPCPDGALPARLKQVIDALQQQEVCLTSDKVLLDSQLRSLQQEIKTLKTENEKVQKSNSDLKTIQQHQQSLVHRLQKKLHLVSRERDSYRTQLDTYERDLTVLACAGGAEQAQLAAQRQRIDNLEQCLVGYRDMVHGLETQLPDCPHEPPVHAEQLARLQAHVDRLTGENGRLTARCDELEVRLEQQLVGRDAVQQGGKVLHLKMNPASEMIAGAEAQVHRLQEENDRLKRKVRKMEEGLESSKLSETVCSSREAQTLRDEKQALEVKMQRLKDYFKSSSSEFREVCYMLLGYKIDRASGSTYKLSSMYADTPDDHLQFKLNADGSLHMLETQFSSTLDELMELHLRQQDSIPAFLSALTMDLFSRTTSLQ